MSTPAAAASTGPSRRRILLARGLVILAALIGVIAMLAGYVRYQALDSETFRGTAAELIADDTVRNQIAATMVDELYANVDVAAQLEAVLPPNLQGLAGPAAGLSRQVADNTAQRLLERPRVQQLWLESLARTQEQLVRLLDGDTTVVQNTNGVVVLDLQPLIIQLGDEVAVIGRLAQSLPEGSGVIAIMDSDDLTLAQDVTHLLDVVGLWLWVVPILLFAIAIAIVPGRRREEVRAVAIAALVAGLLILILRGIAGRYFVENLVEFDSVRPAAQDAWNIVTSLLADGGRTVVGISLILLAGVWFVGPTRSATALRRAAAPYLARGWLAYSAFAALALLILWWGPTAQTRRPLQMLVAAVVFAVAFEALRRVTARETPPTTPS